VRRSGQSKTISSSWWLTRSIPRSQRFGSNPDSRFHGVYDCKASNSDHLVIGLRSRIVAPSRDVGERERCLVRYIPEMLLLAFCIVVASFVPAKAQQLQVAIGVFCDAESEVVSLFDEVIRKDKPLADGIKVVNGDVQPPRCALGKVALIPGELTQRLEHNGKVYGVFRVLVLGFEHNGQWVRFPQPVVQFGSRPLIGEASA